MSKPLAGRRLFDARGRSAASRGLPINYQRTQRHQLPPWAQAAWICGWLDQSSNYVSATDHTVPASPKPAQDAAPVLEDDLTHEAEMNARATWREGADLDDIELDELDEPYEEEECSRCRGDGRDPRNDYLLPCPECQGEQQP